MRITVRKHHDVACRQLDIRFSFDAGPRRALGDEVIDDDVCRTRRQDGRQHATVRGREPPWGRELGAEEHRALQAHPAQYFRKCIHGAFRVSCGRRANVSGISAKHSNGAGLAVKKLDLPSMAIRSEASQNRTCYLEASLTTERAASIVFSLLFVTAFVTHPASAQPSLSLSEAIQRARTHNPDVGTAAAAEREAGERVAQARGGYFPRVDVSESWQRGNHPVFVFSSLLAQRQFSSADFALDALNHPTATNNF